MRNNKTFLFFPIDIGLAHLVRPIAVAEELVRQGHRAIVAMPKRKQQIFKHIKSEIVDISTHIEDDFKIRIADFSNYEFFKNLVSEELVLIDKYKPDAIIVDFRLSALAAGIIAGCKTYAITNSDGLPYGSYLPNPGFSPIVHKLILPIIQKIYDKKTRTYIQPLLQVVHNHGMNISFDEWFERIEYIIPEPHFYMPPVAKHLKIHHVSPLVWQGFGLQEPAWLEDIRPNGKTVYLTFGGTGFDRQKLINLAVQLVKNGYRVIVTTGTICLPSDFPNIENLYVAQFLQGEGVSRRVDIIVCHGGYGTATDAVMAGKPAVLIPFNPDQILHASRMEELGVAKCLFKMNIADVINVFTLNWSSIEEKGKNISVNTVVSAVRDVVEHKNRYDDAIKAFQAGYKHKTGMEEVVNILSMK